MMGDDEQRMVPSCYCYRQGWQAAFPTSLSPGDSQGWMKPSIENQLAAAKGDDVMPDQQFTRQEIMKHNTKDNCWLVINGNVHDWTNVLSWHPGGSATLLANARKLSLDVSSQFENIHDEYAHKNLSECVIGRVADKAHHLMKEQAKANQKRQRQQVRQIHVCRARNGYQLSWSIERRSWRTPSPTPSRTRVTLGSRSWASERVSTFNLAYTCKTRCSSDLTRQPGLSRRKMTIAPSSLP